MIVADGLELLDEPECWQLLRRGVIGRIGLSMDATPVIFPVNYAVLDDTIVFLTAPGTKLSAAIDASVVAFEVDDYDRDARSGWSVLVIGTAREAADPKLMLRLLELNAVPYAHGERSHTVQITPTFVSGRRIV